ncbi:ABC transporter ATP-binding protein [uncultured Clostridium sp.]|uniref:ABC transporter ATP-binding protein n=1 Tax=uncultured Clostridium sp. TaxID=59620 RepID=UPI002599D2F5|nr:ABC transporter ATP-binding protein [uncultured Clostridium sp.]
MKEVLKVALKNSKKYIIGILISSLISSYLLISLAKFISYVIDGVIMETGQIPSFIVSSFYNNDMISKLIVLGIYMFIIIFAISILNYIKSLFNTKLKLSMNKNLKTKLLEHVTYLEYNDYINYGKEQILQRISNDSNNFIDFVCTKCNLIIDSLFIFLFSMYEIFNLNILVSIVILVIIIIITIMSIWYLKITKPIVNKNIDLHEKIISKTINIINNAKMIKIFNKEKDEIEEFNKISNEYNKNDKRLIDYLIYYELIGTGLRKFKDPFIFLIGGIFVINGNMNIGTLMVLMTYSSNLLEYVVQIIYMINDVNIFLVPTNRLSYFLSLKEENKNDKLTIIDDISLEFKNVTIKVDYMTILENVSFKIEKGKKIYLVGENGSGKSIIIRVLLGFIPYKGQILLGGIDLKELSRATLRNYIGVIFQEPFILDDTIRNNIDVFGKYNTLEKIDSVIKICELTNEVNEMPNKYNELLGEKGIKLSGGQKQRISIARTLLQDNDIIIFDDALSKVDESTKKKIKSNLKELNKDKISIYITQDLSKLENNETIFFIDNKKIIIGKHQELIRKNKNYNKLVNICKNAIENRRIEL